MPLFRLAFSSLLLAVPFFSRAQATEPAATPRFYVGLGAYSSFYQPLGGQTYATTTSVRLPVQLTAGYQLRPRLAVQLGVAYSGNTTAYFNEGYYYNPTTTTGSTYFEYAGANTARNTSVSGLARYTLTRKAAHRVQFDALGGLTLEHLTSYDRGTRADSLGGTLNVVPYSQRRTQNVFLLSAGLGTRVRLVRHLELTYDLILHTALPDSRGTGGLTSSSALGLRYRFGK